VLRIRLTYAKRGRACFIPHIAIPSVFSRSGNRAGISFQLSEGFSPRPRISLGPELPVGVPALSEPLEVRLDSFSAEDLLAWDRALPPGFFFTGPCRVNGEPGSAEARSLNKWCEVSSCLLALRREPSGIPLLESFLRELKDRGEVLFFEPADSWSVRCILENPAQRSPGVLVKELQKRGIIEGWPDIFLLREVVGRLGVSEETGAPCVLPLTPPFATGTGRDAEEDVSGERTPVAGCSSSECR